MSPDRHGTLRARPRDGLARPARRPRPASARRRARGRRAAIAVLEQHLAAQVEDQRGRVVDVELDADAADRRCRRGARSARGGRRSRPRSTSPALTSPRSVSSATRLETVALFRPVSWAMRARDREPASRRWRRTSPRLLRRTVAWSAGRVPPSRRAVEPATLVGHATPPPSDRPTIRRSCQQITARTACRAVKLPRRNRRPVRRVRRMTVRPASPRRRDDPRRGCRHLHPGVQGRRARRRHRCTSSGPAARRTRDGTEVAPAGLGAGLRRGRGGGRRARRRGRAVGRWPAARHGLPRRGRRRRPGRAALERRPLGRRPPPT